jgi:hypothetical protein
MSNKSAQPTRAEQIAALEKDWATNPRWKGVKRGYSAADVVRLRGSMQPEYTLAKSGAEKLWAKVNGGAKKGYVNAFGAITAGPGHAAGQGWPRSGVSVGMAGCSRRQHQRNDVSRPVALCLRLGAHDGPPYQQYVQARR